MPTLLTIRRAAALIQCGELTPAQLVEGCLERIARLDHQIRAWVSVDQEGALAEARRAENEIRSGQYRGPLHGIPMGIKDIIDVQGWPTRAASPLRADHVAAEDAEVVRQLRAAGAIILGKTVTTEWACFDPAPTQNPWNVGHTPGGSSSGSAAAVALGMCLGSIGTQTGGSIIRPAAYCGVAGFKPSYGLLSLEGVELVSHSLDHMGAIARKADDLDMLFAAVRAPATARSASGTIGFAARPVGDAGKRSRLGILREYFFDEADREVRSAVTETLAILSAGGAELLESALPIGFSEVQSMHRVIMAAEVAIKHRRAFLTNRESYGPNITALLEEGLAIHEKEYQSAIEHREQFRVAVAEIAAKFDALIMPATPTTAPDNLDTTGDPRFNSPWSYAGLPAVTVPFSALSPAGLPIGIQLVGPAHSDEQLLHTAAWCEDRLNFQSFPGGGAE